jgi:methionyl-tRNA formyltransferase
MRVVFLGSGSFAIPSLEALLDAGHDVAAVVTQPDREKGRGRALSPPPLKPVAAARGLKVLQPRRVREPESVAALEALAPEVQVVVAYGQILPRRVIDIAPLGTVNVHASLLPRYRGAAPVQWAIVNGEAETGVTTMLIDEGLDTGPLLLAEATPIGPEETAEALESRLAALGGQLLVRTLKGLQEGAIVPQPQDPARARLAPLIKKEDGLMDWRLPAPALARRVLGFHAWPGAHTRLRGRGLRILRAHVEDAAGSTPERAKATPGTLLRVGRDGLVVACGEGTALRLLEVQPESRRPMPAAAFAAGARLAPGERLG